MRFYFEFHSFQTNKQRRNRKIPLSGSPSWSTPRRCGDCGGKNFIRNTVNTVWFLTLASSCSGFLVDPGPVIGTLGMGQEYTLDGMPVLCGLPFTPRCNLEQPIPPPSKFLGGEQRTQRKPIETWEEHVKLHMDSNQSSRSNPGPWSSEEYFSVNHGYYKSITWDVNSVFTTLVVFTERVRLKYIYIYNIRSLISHCIQWRSHERHLHHQDSHSVHYTVHELGFFCASLYSRLKA